MINYVYFSLGIGSLLRFLSSGKEPPQYVCDDVTRSAPLRALFTLLQQRFPQLRFGTGLINSFLEQKVTQSYRILVILTRNFKLYVWKPTPDHQTEIFCKIDRQKGKVVKLSREASSRIQVNPLPPEFFFSSFFGT